MQKQVPVISTGCRGNCGMSCPYSKTLLTKHQGAVCVGKALVSDGVNSKRISHSLGTLCPLISGEVNCQRRAAFNARSAKYGLGPGASGSACETLPAGST